MFKKGRTGTILRLGAVVTSMYIQFRWSPYEVALWIMAGTCWARGGTHTEPGDLEGADENPGFKAEGTLQRKCGVYIRA